MGLKVSYMVDRITPASTPPPSLRLADAIIRILLSELI